MALITFLSDFGDSDHYVAAVKASILKINSNLKIVDISHNIEPNNIAQASHVLKYVYKDFPDGTVHLVAVDSQAGHKLIAVKIENHFFLGSDNGLLGLIADNPSNKAVDLNSINPINSKFPAKEILAPAAAKIASGKDLQELGKQLEEYKLMLPRQIRATRRQIAGNVVRVDHYGNLITNINEEVFKDLSNKKKYSIQFARERLGIINESCNSVENGECFAIFNSYGFLEIGINKGNAAQLLGLDYDSPIFINFEE